MAPSGQCESPSPSVVRAPGPDGVPLLGIGEIVTVSRRLVLSTHFDDAVLSCWHAIVARAEPAEAVAVTVATVFGGAPPDGADLADWDRASGASSPHDAWLARRSEDRTALETTGAQVIHLPFVDAPYRTGPAPRAGLTEALDELVQDFDEVWIPAGIGGHEDHLLVAATALHVTGGRRRRLYADLPYAVSGAWSALVEAARRGQHDDVSLRAQLDASPFLPPSTAPVLSELSPPSRSRSCEQ